jgi:hypothetical protein
MSTKSTLMKKLEKDLRENISAENIFAKRKGKDVNLSLINQFKKHDFIPNKWFDWQNRADAEIMIIGQDWGPYKALEKYIVDYENSKNGKDFDYNAFLFKTFSSRTEKFIFKVIEETYTERFKTFDKKIHDKFFYTMAVLFTRQGIHFRGNHNFDEAKSFEISYPYVARQIEIVRPKVIITIGNLGFKVVNRYYKLNYGKIKLTDLIKEIGSSAIQLNESTVIPNFHPASFTDPKIQKQIWSKIWDYI